MAYGQYGYNPIYQTGGYGQPMPDQLAQWRAQQAQQMQYSQMQNMQTPPVQQNTGVPIWVQGEAGAKSYLVAPGNSVILMDSENSVFYIKSTDASGVPQPLRIFEYVERTGAPQGAQAAQGQTTDYVTRAEFAKLVERINNMTTHSEEEAANG